MLLVFDTSVWFSLYLEEYKVKQFHLTFDYVEHLRNLVGLNCMQEKFCYKKVLFHHFCQPSVVFISTYYFNFNLKINFS